MAAALPPSHLFHHLLLRPTPTPQPSSALISIFIRPMLGKTITTAAVQSKTLICNRIHNTLFSSRSRCVSFCRQSMTFHQTPATAVQSEGAALSSEAEEEDEDEEIEDYYDDEDDDGEGEEIENGSENSELEETAVEEDSEVAVESGSAVFGVYTIPSLTVKEKKDLASYAHSLGKKLKSQSVGKSGFTANVATSFMETLEANELLKIKIHRSCPGELDDVLQQLEVATGSVVVSKIGRTVIIYKPSLAKLKAEEKRRQARRIFVRKESQMKPTLLKKAQLSRPSGRAHRGSSRP